MLSQSIVSRITFVLLLIIQNCSTPENTSQKITAKPRPAKKVVPPPTKLPSVALEVRIPLLARLSELNPDASPKASPKAKLRDTQEDANTSQRYFLTGSFLPLQQSDYLSQSSTDLKPIEFVIDGTLASEFDLYAENFDLGQTTIAIHHDQNNDSDGNSDPNNDRIVLLQLHERNTHGSQQLLKNVALIQADQQTLLSVGTSIATELASRNEMPLIVADSLPSIATMVGQLDRFEARTRSQFKATPEASLPRIIDLVRYYIQSQILQDKSLQEQLHTHVNQAQTVLKNEILKLGESDEKTVTQTIGNPLALTMQAMLEAHSTHQQSYLDEVTSLMTIDAILEKKEAATAVVGISTQIIENIAATIFVLGQPSPTEKLQVSRGLYNVRGVFSDGQRVFVADTTNNRVLIWKDKPTENGQAADIVLGQPNLGVNFANQEGVSGRTLKAPHGVFFDGTRLFVGDSGNNRVLIWNTLPTASGKAADVVLGQSNMTTNASAAQSGTTLNNPTCVVSNGSQLFVCDSENSRILIWNTIPVANAQAADVVVGQTSLTVGAVNQGGNVGPTSLHVPMGVGVNGSRLFVADTGNHRILVWNTIPTTHGQGADYVIGQTDMVSDSMNNGALSPASLASPTSVQSFGERLFVADQANNRLLIWNTRPTTNGAAADIVLGQTSMTTATMADPSHADLLMPASIFFDGTALFAADTSFNRVLIWQTLPTAHHAPANIVIGQSTMAASGANNNMATALTFNQQNGIFSDGSHFFVADRPNNRVLIWNTMPTTSLEAADIVLGQPHMTASAPNNGGLSPSTLRAPTAIYSDGTRLFIADAANNRVLAWRSIPTTNRQAADFVLGQPDMTTNTANTGGLSATTLHEPRSVFSDGTRLCVSDSANNRLLIWNTLPTSNSQAADLVLGQPNMVSSSSNTGGIAATTLSNPVHGFFDGTHMGVADRDNHRILLWTNPPGVDGQAANIVLGQPNMDTGLSTTTALENGGLLNPDSVASDGNHLFVTDTSHNRILIWNSLPTANAQLPDQVFGQSDMTTKNANSGGVKPTTLFFPNDTFSDGTQLFISDKMNHRIVVVQQNSLFK